MMSLAPVKISRTASQSGAANECHPDAIIISLAAEVAQRCSELDILDASNGLPDTENHSIGGADMLDARTAEIAADLDRLEEKIAKNRAVTIEGLRAKATVAAKLRRFGHESIPDSIIRDLITDDSPLAHPGELSAT